MNYQSFQVKSSTTLYPTEEIDIQIPPSMQCNTVNVTMRRDFAISQTVFNNPHKGYVTITNNSNQIQVLPKHAHIADVRTCIPIDSLEI